MVEANYKSKKLGIAGIILIFGAISLFVHEIFLTVGGVMSRELSFPELIMEFLLWLVPLIVLAAMCRRKKRSVFLAIPVGVLAFYNLITLVIYRYSSWMCLMNWSLSFIAYALLVLYIISQTVKRAEGLKRFATILGIAVILILVVTLCIDIINNVIGYVSRGGDELPDILGWYVSDGFRWLALMIIIVGIFFVLTGFTEKAVVKQPGQTQNGAENAGSGEITADNSYISLGKHILLLLFTGGIWQYIWVYKISKNINKDAQANPVMDLVLCMFIPFYQIYWAYKYSKMIDELAKEKGINSDSAVMNLILAIVFPIVAYVMMQNQINNVVTAKGEAVSQVAQAATKTKADEIPDVATELRKYNELLKDGIITQEEYDKKKKELLG